MKKLLLILFLFSTQISFGQNTQREVIGRDIGQIKGIKILVRITDEITGDPLIGATATVPELAINKVTDTNGTIELILDRAEYNLQFRYVGYQTIDFPITAVGDGRISIRMIQEDFQLDDVVIFGRDPEKNIRSTDMGAVTLSMNTIKELPPFLGEVDIIRSLATLPGVSQVGEAAAGLNVRGGTPDQNLVQFAGAPIYNPTHLFGLFTAFNADIVNDVTLYKSFIPSKYGGRGSSILDIVPKAGSIANWGGDLMVGTTSGKLSINGPILKDKISILGGLRGSYINWFLKALRNPDLKNSRANFNDANLIISAPISEGNELTYSFYRSYDDFAFASDTTVSWINTSHSLQWKSQFTEKLVLHALGYFTQYDYEIFNQSGFNDFELKSNIRDLGAKLNFSYDFSPKNRINVGGDFKRLEIQPGELTPSGDEQDILPKKVQNEQGIESGLFFQHEFELGESFGITYGLRYDMFQYLGPRTVQQYDENKPLSEGTATGEVVFTDGEKIANYNGLGPRVSMRYSLSKSSSIKAGYNRMYQFIHLISNTATIAPTDVWKLSDNFIEPQIVDQYSLGLYKNLKGNIFETSVEVYYKGIQNVVEYKDGVNLILQDHLETELVPAEGRTYGVEVYVKKNLGRMTGWVAYTYSRSLRRVITPFEENTINDGEWYSSNYDKPHEVTVIGNYKIRNNISLSATFGFSTGRPVTYPVAKFDYSGISLAYFDRRNEQRLPNFHRLDLALNFKLNGKGKFFEGDWTFSVLNVYGRKNAFSLFFVDELGSPPQANQLSILGVPLPSLSYAIKF